MLLREIYIMGGVWMSSSLYISVYVFRKWFKCALHCLETVLICCFGLNFNFEWARCIWHFLLTQCHLLAMGYNKNGIGVIE